MPKDVMSYIHVLVYHIHEMILIHRTLELKSFLCSAIEHKNHDHVLLFFRHTMKDGGKEADRKSAISNILEYENRLLYYFTHILENTLEKPKKLRIK